MSDLDPMTRRLRDGADPGLAPGAAERIAAGAWDRAARLRADGAPRRLALRRAGWIAAAAALLVAGVFALRGSDAAFAVEGDPVMVQRGDGWVSTLEVPADVFVRAPAGVRLLRSRAGDVLRPSPGSLFRLVAERSTSRPVWRAEFTQGGGVVDGAGVVVAMRGEVRVERDPAASKFRLSFGLDEGGPRFAVGAGRAVARALGSGEHLSLDASENAAYLTISVTGGVERRFAKVEKWSPAAASQIAGGAVRFVDADFHGSRGITLVGGTGADGFLAFDVPSAAVTDALKCVNGAAAFRALVNVRCATTSPTRYVYEKDATRVEVDVDACGAVTVVSPSGRRTFANVDAFRRDAPDLAALFGDTIKK
jgi:hypothetical protein